jgi:hypothetical protein
LLLLVLLLLRSSLEAVAAAAYTALAVGLLLATLVHAVAAARS